MNNKVLITGTAGFIGFHVAIKLAELGYEVWGIDNINDYYDVNLKYARLEESGIPQNKVVWGKWINSTKYPS